ncbi:MAG TPA: hypothetical protein VG944_08460, partial [Fimbriimonas sp.]|nr:hypothetical protein [Fimbriimonas sp.]
MPGTRGFHIGSVWQALVGAALLALPCLSPAQLRPSERKGLDDALYIGNLTEDDLGYEKKITDDPYRLPLNQIGLDDPLRAADQMMQLHSGATGTLSQILASGCDAAFGDKAPEVKDPTLVQGLPVSLPEQFREPVQFLVGAIADATYSVHHAIQQLSPTEKRELIEGLPRWASTSNLVKLSFVKTPQQPPSRLLELLTKVDLASIRQAALKLSAQIEGELPKWRSLASSVAMKGSLRFRIQGFTVEIAGQDDDVHTSRDTNLCIDLGGRNRYTGRFGAGIGYASVLIDC